MGDEALARELSLRGITDRRVLDAIGSLDRSQFVPASERARATSDQPLPIGHGQTISQPYIVGFMSQALHVQPGERILEIGTGSGYQAAVLARLGAEVHTVEIVPPARGAGEGAPPGAASWTGSTSGRGTARSAGRRPRRSTPSCSPPPRLTSRSRCWSRCAWAGGCWRRWENRRNSNSSCWSGALPTGARWSGCSPSASCP